ncbi:ABC transporter ATP-binding protein [Candidatus Dependentiae bacterium]|nr:ABC transporter ATP-binding protein [Candidatus Dependentiae bacterium]
MNKKILLSIKNVIKTFSTKPPIHALKGVNLDIYEGEVLSLLGVNGAGKTTLSSIISTLHPATSGDIFYKNQSIYQNVTDFRRIIGFCPQKPNIDEMLTIKENLLFAGRYFNMPEELIQKRSLDLMEKFQLLKYADAKGSILSGGYKQRFILARTLMHSPKLIILDEPTVALDPHIRRHLWDIIKSLKNEGITILLTTHYIEEAEILSDRVCILDKGVIKLIDTPENLKKNFSQSNLENVFIKLLQEEKEELGI